MHINFNIGPFKVDSYSVPGVSQSELLSLVESLFRLTSELSVDFMRRKSSCCLVKIVLLIGSVEVECHLGDALFIRR